MASQSESSGTQESAGYRCGLCDLMQARSEQDKWPPRECLERQRRLRFPWCTFRASLCRRSFGQLEGYRLARRCRWGVPTKPRRRPCLSSAQGFNLISFKCQAHESHPLTVYFATSGEATLSKHYNALVVEGEFSINFPSASIATVVAAMMNEPEDNWIIYFWIPKWAQI